MTKINELHNIWMQNGDYQTAYAALEDEFALAKAVIEARSHAGLNPQNSLDANPWQGLLGDEE